MENEKEHKEELLDKETRLKPPKEDSDDTTSNGSADSMEYEVSARRSRRAMRRDYKAFKRENSGFWAWFNSIILLFSLGMGGGTYYFLQDPDNVSCGGIKLVLWTTIILHFVNSLMAMINLCGLEMKLCNSNMVCCFSIFEMTMLVFMQVTYFRSQDDNCIT